MTRLARYAVSWQKIEKNCEPMADWEKLNSELDDALNSMTSEDWRLWALKNVKKMENRKTEQKLSAEWLIDWMGKNQYFIGNDLLKATERAKEMEKEAHQETWDVAHQAGRFEGKGIAKENWQTFETYWEENFKTRTMKNKVEPFNLINVIQVGLEEATEEFEKVEGSFTSQEQYWACRAGFIEGYEAAKKKYQSKQQEQ
jgi:hypothetical protein